ncbi:hypothetical protein ES332_A09G152500v1 [Gossypium tomentosum]|uniref:Uncharacterized protein n=1 Tax=Gossypium tomentosum TaxID=34277 RepID=A0A5D2P7G0_GOSTO|nr:hypothetical protein ES332_A09G152500v1 [Gossypium tomentosum]
MTFPLNGLLMTHLLFYFHFPLMLAVKKSEVSGTVCYNRISIIFSRHGMKSVFSLSLNLLLLLSFSFLKIYYLYL